MKKIPLLILGAIGVSLVITVAETSSARRNVIVDVPPEQQIKKAAAPKIEVCFVLDTTGSMSGLIEAAKQKIWSISNQIVKGSPTPELKIGLVAYRDRGDEYVTRDVPLTDDIDKVYASLTELRADGGGDEPESVNEAMTVAVRKMAWSQEPGVLKIIFLVGDAPPHMDYADDVKYPDICQEAVRKNIVINTVQCGAIAETVVDWQKIARLAEGRYVAIAQSGGVAVIASPMDEKLAALNAEVGKTLVPYGKEDERQEVHAKQALAERSFASPASAPAASDRLLYNSATKKSVQGGHELVDEYDKNPGVVKAIPAKDLPAELQKLDADQLTSYLSKQKAARADLQKQIEDLAHQREKYLETERAKLTNRDGFDEEVAKILRDEKEKKSRG